MATEAPKADPPVDSAATTELAIGEAGEEKISKKELKRRQAKAEKEKKKLEHQKKAEEEKKVTPNVSNLTPKPKAEEVPGELKDPVIALEENAFNSGWLKGVYNEKPISDIFTRFPPEPNGFLHIGHAKAITINFGFAKHHGGQCYLRYDDTNPSKEEEIYFTAIKDIVEWLGFKPYQITYSSDHFDRLYDLAEKLVLKDKAYVCHCSREQINLQRGGPDNRGTRFGCEHRTRPVEESLTEFRGMRDGKYKAGEAFLRMKQKLTDLSEGNPQMWDLPAYRVTEKNYHHRTGDKWRIYPTYDFTHCICDAFENISHSLCTTEFRQSRISYDWLLEQLDMKVPASEEKGPMQREYGRLHLEGTILSKRRIQMLVEGTVAERKRPDGSTEMVKIPPAVRGWDDPRLFTLVALRRRGVPAMAMREFVLDLGVSSAKTDTEIHKFESIIQSHLDDRAPRLMLIPDPIKVVIEGVTTDDQIEKSLPFGKGKPLITAGERKMTFSREVFIDSSDFRETDDDPDYRRLAPGKIVGLLNTVCIQATSFTKDDSGRVTEIRAVKVDSPPKNIARVQWVDAATGVQVEVRKYAHLFDYPSPEELNWSDGSWAEHLNPNSEITLPNAIVERGINDLIAAHGKNPPSSASDNLVRFQALRVGYFCIDPQSDGDKILLNQIVSLKDGSKSKDEPETKGKGKGSAKNQSKKADTTEVSKVEIPASGHITTLPIRARPAPST